jgi:hypothetical protein
MWLVQKEEADDQRRAAAEDDETKHGIEPDARAATTMLLRQDTDRRR